ncbi:DUF3108 domain-containing protein [Variovorax sp. YR216]|uniref:DUF3108 domain-containing protein n=1 Tax=Variovorax sp. YR216 TaxID=1882828 RepID=UPI00089D2586|nr:DUF3108 domain-containing protein [Variovorax sp. YR216]SEA68824.1 Protein of unknown function [Variovorax sp. YR216]
MPTSTLLPPFHAPRPRWRTLAVVTAIVLAGHLAVLGLAPVSVRTPPPPEIDKFVTRTIIVAPPAASEPPASTPPPKAETKPAPKPPRPRPVARPRPIAPAPAPTPETMVPTQPDSQDLVSQAPETTPAPEAPAPGAAAPGNGNGNGRGAGQGTGEGDVGGNIPGSVPLRISGSVRLAFAATAQQGAQPMQGAFGDLVWQQDGTHYDASLSIKFLFVTFRSTRSTGAIGPTGIEPQRYSDKRRSEVASHFVRDQKTVVFSNNSPAVPLLAGAQDRLSVVLQLGALMAGDPGRYPPDSVIAVQTVGTSDAEIWTFTLSGEEQVAVQAGEFTARKLTRNPRKPFDDKIELWLAPDLGYLPIRIRQTQPNGDFIDLQLREKVSMQ